ncbi:hypothetical protein KH5H1_72480 [Corallococcus caeni]|uniref:Uncharacterized protein n=2 Tax=Corallococcus TaxID=83461 RepID=A0A7Y4JYJ6_9BACT|nr:hypothetical protein [Corallococcus exercitus]NOK13158.1 hypothetical protein [Corallococcus exercitus]GMU03127.1 hypothetical protein KH5H1_72480 [Corallococcus sp. KH5-1]GMU11334.1 hypothetical protein ASNO1_75880 [Corallococcus sp. NO1]
MASIDALRQQARANWRTWLAWVATPIAALPLLGVGGLRRVGLVDELAAGAVGLGLLSLTLIGLGQLPRTAARPAAGKAWEKAPRDFPISGAMVPEEFAASTASGH